MTTPMNTRARRAFARIARVGVCVLLAAILYFPGRVARAGVVGTSAGDFLSFEIGAGSAGLAGAQTSVASGASAQFWNPALLAGMSNPQASMMHASWLGNLQYDWIGYARPLGPKTGTGSVSLAYFHMPGVNGFDQFDNPTGEFKVYDMALTVGLARPIVRGLNLGMNAKLIRQTLATVSGTGAAVDLGASGLIAGTSLGATVQNLGPGISFSGASYPLPRQIRFGVGRDFMTDRLLLTADYNIPNNYYRDLRVGAEIRPHPVVAVRVGYRHELGTSDDPATGLSFGLGAHVGPVNLDYAMTPDNDFADIHRLSFGYTFGGAPVKPEPRKPPTPQPPAPKGPPVVVIAPTPQPELVPAAPKAKASDVYEVVLGSYQSEASARAELKALQILGFSVKDAKVGYLPGMGYRLTLASLNSKKSADALAASLSRLSFTPRVEVAHR